MNFKYVLRNGQRLEENVARNYDGMASAFLKDTGCSLIVTSGTRTDAEQEKIFRDRYVTAANIKGRKVYDTRVWNGVLWYRISSAGTVAVPKTSNHQESGPNGPRSIDIRDSGANAGVTVRGSSRDKWMEKNASRWNFENEGYKFGEPWHKTFRGTIGGSSSLPATGGLKFSKAVQDQQKFLIKRGFNLGKWGADGLPGPMYKAAVKAYQAYLRSKGWYQPPLILDGAWGAGTQAGYLKDTASVKPVPKKPATIKPTVMLKWNWHGIASFLRATGYYKGNNIPGPVMVSAMQRWLNANGYNAGKPDGIIGSLFVQAVQRWLNKTGRKAGVVDGIPGGNTHSAWKKAENENWIAFPKGRI